MKHSENCGAPDEATAITLYFIPTREILISLVMLPARPFMSGMLDGWCVMATARRPS